MSKEYWIERFNGLTTEQIAEELFYRFVIPTAYNHKVALPELVVVVEAIMQHAKIEESKR